MKNRLKNLLIALDQLAYVVLTLGYGSPDETLSSAAWRMDQKGRLTGRIFRPLIDRIFSILGEDKHCFRAYIAEKSGTQLPKGLR